MRLHFMAAMAAASILSACEPATDAPPAAGTSPAAATAADPLIAKRLIAENGTTFLFNADGTVGGVLGGEAIVGTYTADSREICSTYTTPKRLSGRAYCSVPVIDGSVVIFNRRDGSQSQPYRIEG